MRFKPTNRRLDESPARDPLDGDAFQESDADLPAEFVSLGRQLSDDAAWLAARYPARESSSDPIVPVGMRRNISWLSAAAAILAISGGTWIALRTPPTAAPSHPSVDNFAAQRTLPADAPITDSVLDAGEAYVLAAGLTSADGLIVPAVLFQNLSGPEQEGLLDLLDELVPEAIDFSM